MATEKKSCSKCCRRLLITNEFFKEKKNGFSQLCLKCLDKNKLNMKKNECIHGKHKFHCIQCDGVSLCDHKKPIGKCKNCVDPIHIRVIRMINVAKRDDKNNDCFDEANFIDVDHVSALIQEANDQCHYCCCQIQYSIRNNRMANCMRLDQNIGHTKGNCIIVCSNCSILKCVGDSKKRKRD